MRDLACDGCVSSSWCAPEQRKCVKKLHISNYPNLYETCCSPPSSPSTTVQYIRIDQFHRFSNTLTHFPALDPVFASNAMKRNTCHAKPAVLVRFCCDSGTKSTLVLFVSAVCPFSETCSPAGTFWAAWAGRAGRGGRSNAATQRRRSPAALQQEKKKKKKD